MMIEAPDHPTDPALEDRWAALQAKFDTVAELSHQGSILRKTARSGREVWVLRYVDRTGGRAIHRSVYFGDDPELVQRAERMLERYREQRRRLEEIGRYARLAAGFVQEARRLARPG